MGKLILHLLLMTHLRQFNETLKALIFQLKNGKKCCLFLGLFKDLEIMREKHSAHCWHEVDAQ